MKRIILIGLLLLLVACSNDIYHKVIVKERNILEHGFEEVICLTDDNVTLLCFDCLDNITQFCKYGENIFGNYGCWC